jgi:CheY-like chemotaxis protein
MLVAEDSREEVEIFTLALERARVNLPVRFVSSGEEAVEYLKGEGRFADRAQHPLPTVLLLDLKMPGMGGFGVLAWIRKEESGVSRLPVVVFTSSEEPEDINHAYDLGANSYLVKPVGLENLEKIARLLESYWFGLNRRPDCAAS